jgi:hypothetical protein
MQPLYIYKNAYMLICLYVNVCMFTYIHTYIHIYLFLSSSSAKCDEVDEGNLCPYERKESPGHITRNNLNRLNITSHTLLKGNCFFFHYLIIQDLPCNPFYIASFVMQPSSYELLLRIFSKLPFIFYV